MSRTDIVLSPCSGIVKQIQIQLNGYVHEWEEMFCIQREDGELEKIREWFGGEVESIQVSEGQRITENTVLASIKPDMTPQGCD